MSWSFVESNLLILTFYPRFGQTDKLSLIFFFLKGQRGELEKILDWIRLFTYIRVFYELYIKSM